jgi:hypothetical protein
MKDFKIIVTKDFLRLKIVLITIYVFLEFYYHFFISDNFQYMGFNPDLNLIKYIITKFIFLGLLVFSYKIYLRSTFLYAVFLILILFFYLPNAIIFSFSNGSYAPFLATSFFVSTFLFSPYLRFKLPVFKMNQKNKSRIIFALPFLLLIPIVLVFKTNFNLKTLLLLDVYETRELFSLKMTGMLNYIYNFQVKTIIPIALVFFMVRKKYLWVGLLTLALLYLYVISGNKIVYFTTFIIVFFYYLGSDYVSKISNFFIITLALLIATPFIDNLLLGAPILGGTFVNRFLFIPALLTQWYFEFFDGNPFYFAESHFFNQFVESPYDMPVGFLLTKIYWNEPTVFANNGIVSDGFMNLGYYGVILFSGLFTLLFSLFNSFKLNKGYFGLFFCYIYIILSAPFLTCLITGGIVLFILLWFFILNNKTVN